ncbi:hypothetical protein WN990_37030 [Kitasatospora purpeofusca]|uniref:hypothetical protein n=1 Tax=Kitasatospora purpeofusca TaxID=67352 RepID=UPI0030F171F6
MHEHLDALEAHMQRLQHAMRQAQEQHDSAQLTTLRQELQRTQSAWNALFTPGGEPQRTQPPAAPPAPDRTWGDAPVREQVQQVLALTAVPTAPRILSEVHEAFFSRPLNTARLTTLRRDEERSFRNAPYNRNYYVCSALTFDLLSPARALLALSTWPLEQRLIGPLTHRVNFLTSTMHLADAAERLPGDAPLPAAVQQLLLRCGRNIPDYPVRGPLDLDALRRTAAAELAIHAADDADTRTEAARRARDQLGDVQQIFGSTLHDAARQRRTS